MDRSDRIDVHAALPPSQITLRAMTIDDAAEVLRIYQQGIETGHATFAASAPDWQTWDSAHLHHSRLVAQTEGTVIATAIAAVIAAVIGWAALSAVSSREVYRGVGEISIYVSANSRGTGVGRRLMAGLIEAAEAAGMWTLQAGIFPENPHSIALHEKFGFRQLGIRKNVGRMSHGSYAGKWRDVVLMERRSEIVGIG